MNFQVTKFANTKDFKDLKISLNKTHKNKIFKITSNVARWHEPNKLKIHHIYIYL